MTDNEPLKRHPRFCQQIEWADVPHLSEEQKQEQLDATPEYQRDARTRGIPILGAGAIFPMADSAFLIDAFRIPSHWPRAYGFDADWNRTAAVWGAWDRDSDTVYCYSEYYAEKQPPKINAGAVGLRGEWMTGAMDPSLHGKINPKDGRTLAEMYMADEGLFLVDADNTVEAGLMAMYNRMLVGQLKIFRTLVQLRRQLSIYRRGDDGKVVKQNDDLCDALRYLIMTGMMHATTEPLEEIEGANMAAERGRSETTGY